MLSRLNGCGEVSSVLLRLYDDYAALRLVAGAFGLFHRGLVLSLRPCQWLLEQSAPEWRSCEPCTPRSGQVRPQGRGMRRRSTPCSGMRGLLELGDDESRV